MPENQSRKKKFIKDGVFYAELNDFLTKELAEDGYAGVEVRVTPTCTEVIIRATRTQSVLGEKGRRIRELKALIEKRFNFTQDTVELFAEKVHNRALCALAQAESLRYKLLEGLAVRRACYGVLRFIMEHGAKGCEIIISGKLRGQRAKAMKFRDGYMICSGDATNVYIDRAVKHVMLRQGVLGIKVKIMLPHDPTGQSGPTRNLPDIVTVNEPKPYIVEPDPEPPVQQQYVDPQQYEAQPADPDQQPQYQDAPDQPEQQPFAHAQDVQDPSGAMQPAQVQPQYFEQPAAQAQPQYEQGGFEQQPVGGYGNTPYGGGFEQQPPAEPQAFGQPAPPMQGFGGQPQQGFQQPQPSFSGQPQYGSTPYQ